MDDITAVWRRVALISFSVIGGLLALLVAGGSYWIRQNDIRWQENEKRWSAFAIYKLEHNSDVKAALSAIETKLAVLAEQNHFFREQLKQKGGR